MVSAIISSSVTLLICQNETNLSVGFLTRYDINRTELAQKMARCLLFRSQEEKGLCYVVKTKALRQSAALLPLRLCFHIYKLRFSHEVAQIAY